MVSMLFVLGGIFAILVLLALGITLQKPFSKKKKGTVGPKTAVFCYVGLCAQFFITMLAFFIYHMAVPAGNMGDVIISNRPSTGETIAHSGSEILPTVTETQVPTTVFVDPRLDFTPKASLLSNPDNFQMTWEINVDGEIVDSYTRQDPICFELDKDYFALPGVATFRGNNYRTSATYGTAVIEKETMGVAWSHPIGQLNKWGGCAWTGQPLLVQWDDETKAIMDTM